MRPYLTSKIKHTVISQSTISIISIPAEERERIHYDLRFLITSKYYILDPVLGPVHTNPFSNKNGAVLLHFQKDLRIFVSFSPIHTATPYSFSKRFYTLSALAQISSTHAHFNISASEIGAKFKLASARHFGYSRSNGPAPGRVYFDDVTVFR